MNPFDHIIIEHLKVGWRLVYRDDKIAQLVSPKSTIIPFIAIGLEFFALIIAVFSAQAAFVFAAFCTWLFLLGVAQWLSDKDKTIVIKYDGKQVETIKPK